METTAYSFKDWYKPRQKTTFKPAEFSMIKTRKEIGSGEFFRGAWDIKMNAVGRAQAKQVAAANADKFEAIYCGTKTRHREMAEALAQTNPRAGKPIAKAAFDPMQMGKYEGENVTPKRIAEINEYLTHKPNQQIPGVGKYSGEKGEIPRDWLDRLIGAVQEIIKIWTPGQRKLIVTSGRDTQAVRAWVDKGMPADKSINLNILTKDWDSQPGDMMLLDPRTHKITEVKKAGPDGIYFCRHGETDANGNTKDGAKEALSRPSRTSGS